MSAIQQSNETVCDSRPPGAIPKISVLIITFNHERFIAGALQSILMQRATFPIEIVIGEDASTDATADVIRRYQQQQPELFCVIRAARNRGMYANFTRALAHCRGDYIAILEGDDYWIDPEKLQRQKEFLDAQANCALCFHAAQLVYGNSGRPARIFPENPKPIVTLQELLYKNPIPTCSVVFRRKLLQDPPDWISDLVMIDWPLFVLLTQRGHAGYIDRTMAAYRIHEGGTWSQRPYPARTAAIISMLRQFARYLSPKYRLSLQSNLARIYFELALYHQAEGQTEAAIAAAWRAFANYPVGRVYGTYLAKLLFQRYCIAPVQRQPLP